MAKNTKRDLNTFGGLLYSIMRRNHISQRTLAAKARVHYVHLCREILGGRIKQPACIHELIQHVGCTSDERIRLYQLAEVCPPELLACFVQDQAELALIMIAVWQDEITRLKGNKPD